MKSVSLPAPRLFLALIASLIGASSISIAAVIGPTPVALSGTAAPAGGNYINFANPSLNSSGQVAYYANLTGGSSTRGIFAGAHGSLQAVALQGTAAPAGGNYSNFGIPVLNGAGQVVYTAGLTGGSSSGGIFVGAPGSVQAAALEGTAAPAGGNYSAFVTSPTLNAFGQVAFQSSLTGGSSTRGLFAGARGSLQVVALTGKAAPAGGNYNNLDTFSAINGSGQVAYYASLNGGTSPGGIFAGAPGSVQAAALQGTAAPAGGNYDSLGLASPPVLNNAGQMAISANLIGGSSTWGVFVGVPGSTQAAALQGNAAPGGGNYNSFGVPVLNANGQVAFRSILDTESSKTGIFAGSVGSIQAIARGGTATPDGVGNFGVLDSTVALNATGQVAFTTTLRDTGVTTANDTGLYAGSAGNVVKIVREGDVVDIDPGAGVDFRTVSAISFTTGSGGEDGKGMSFNDDGLLVYRLTFTDSSMGIFTSQIVAIPEPGTLGILVAGGFVCWLSRRRLAR